MRLHVFSLRRGLAPGLFCTARHAQCTARQPSRQPLRCASSAVHSQAQPFAAGDVLELTCTGLSSAGEGVCRTDGGCVVFVEGALPGEKVAARVQLKKKSFARAVKLRSLAPHADAVPAPCRHFGPCGGCTLQSLAYEAQLRHKQEHVTELLARVGRVENAAELVRPIVPCLQQTAHRNKMEFRFSSQSWQPQQQGGGGAAGQQQRRRQQQQQQQQSQGKDAATASGSPARRGGAGGRGPDLRDRGGTGGGSREPAGRAAAAPGFAVGLLLPGSNRVVLPISECLLQPAPANELLRLVGRLCEGAGLQPYDPVTRRGLLQAVVIRTASGSHGSPGAGVQPEMMLNFVTARDGRQQLARLVPAILQQFPSVVSVVNTVSDTSRPQGERAILAEHLLHGRPFLVESLCGLEFEVSANSFFQTNTRQAERLYGLVAEAAELRPSDVVLDLYCGTGTIALALAGRCKEVHGVEVAAPAVRDARRNAARNRVANAEFLLGDLDKVAAQLGEKLPRPDVVVVDPARPGLSPGVVAFLRRCGARRLVYVSCNPATQARDLALLCAPPPAASEAVVAAPGSSSGGGGGAVVEGEEAAFRLLSVQPCDMFPHTMHVESVAVLERI